MESDPWLLDFNCLKSKVMNPLPMNQRQKAVSTAQPLAAKTNPDCMCLPKVLIVLPGCKAFSTRTAPDTAWPWHGTEGVPSHPPHHHHPHLIPCHPCHNSPIAIRPHHRQILQILHLRQVLVPQINGMLFLDLL